MGNDEYPDSNWTVEFMEFDAKGKPVAGWSWTWRGIAFNAKSALEKSVNSMIDEIPIDDNHPLPGRCRAVRVVMDDLPGGLAQKR